MIKIPKHAKRVFKGIIYDVYQWEQETFSGEIRIYEALRRSDVVIIIAVQNDRIFLAREEQAVIGSFWSHFGGFIDQGETPLEAAQRELAEEAGLETDDWILLHIHEHPGKVESQNYIYLARNVFSIGAQKLDSGERIEVVNISWTEWITLLQSSEFRGSEEVASLLLTAENKDASQKLRGLFFEGL